MIANKKTFFSITFIFISTILVYSAGLKGGFLFDDIPNLGDMTRYGDISSWENAKQFVFNGFSGPTGRPISLASFWINAPSWIEGNAFPFKVFNLVIHLLCGLISYVVMLYILRQYQYEKKQSEWIALLAMSLWLLHPMFVSTTLYVVQRMTQLSLLFSLLGIWGYLYGRTLLSTKLIQSYVWMTISIGLATILATFSKENGALLPLLILVIEFCSPEKQNKPIWQWRFVCLGIPSILIAYIVLKEINFSENPWPARNFNQLERLMSEARIVTEYLYRLYIPQIEGQGLYQDGYQVSRFITNPISTLYSIIFLSILFLSAIFFKRKYPLYALAILFFFAAHWMESTFIGLELYFEHRNYAAGIFLFLPLAASIYWLTNAIKPQLAFGIAILIILIFSFMTLQRAILWSDTNRLKIYWAQNNPYSPRAQVDLARYLLAQGENEKANQLIVQTLEKRPDSSLLTVRLMRQKLDMDQLSANDFLWMKNTIIKQRPEPQAALDLRYFVEQIRADNERVKMYSKSMIDVLKTMEDDPKSTWRKNNWRALFLYLEGKLYLSSHNYQKGYDTFLESLKIYNNAETAIAMSMEFTQVDNHEMAYHFLKDVKDKYISSELQQNKHIAHIFNNLNIRLEHDLGYK